MKTALEFFQAQQQAFAATLARGLGAEGCADALAEQAYDSFGRNAAAATEAEPPLACDRGCAACCTLRVGATAPELLRIGRFLRAVQPALQARGIDLVGRLRDADARTRGLAEPARVRLRERCPFVAQGVCVIYPVRPLACRGHASHDRKACADAAAGRAWQVPASDGQRRLRAWVQGAMQSALRDAGLAWGQYELNHGSLLACDDAGAEAAWRAGADPLAPAALDDPAPLGDAFDQLRPAAPPGA